MDKQLEDILNSLPPRAPRSRLEPFADLIDEMRRRSWTFRDIAPRAWGEMQCRGFAEQRASFCSAPHTQNESREENYSNVAGDSVDLRPARPFPNETPGADAATDVYRRIRGTSGNMLKKAPPAPKGFRFRS